MFRTKWSPPGEKKLSTGDADRRLARWVKWATFVHLTIDLPTHVFVGTLHGAWVEIRVRGEGNVALPIVLDTRAPADGDVEVTRELMSDARTAAHVPAWMRELFERHGDLELVRFAAGRAHVRFSWNALPEDADAVLAALSARDRDRAGTYRG